MVDNRRIGGLESADFNFFLRERDNRRIGGLERRERGKKSMATITAA